MQAKTIASTDGAELTLWADATGDEEEAVLFVHGATYGARAMFGVASDRPDQPSWFAAVTDAGRAAFGVDIRGYGRSEFPAPVESLSDTVPGSDSPPVRASTAAADVLAAYRDIADRYDPVHVVAFSWGTIVSGRFVDEYDVEPASLSLVAPVYEPLYGFEDAAGNSGDGGDLDPVRRVTKADARARWNDQIPDDPPASLRFGGENADPVFEAFWETVYDSDQRVEDADEPTVVAPGGFLADVRAACGGAPVYDAGEVTVPTLLVRGAFDTTSTRADALGLFDELGADKCTYTEFTRGTHMLLYEEPRRRLFDAVDSHQNRPA